MKTETIKNRKGIIIGYIETDEKGNKVAKDRYAKKLVKYDKALNKTINLKFANYIGDGDLTLSAIYANSNSVDDLKFGSK